MEKLLQTKDENAIVVKFATADELDNNGSVVFSILFAVLVDNHFIG